MAIRTVTGTILRSNGDPWAGAVVRFVLLDDTFTLSPDETFPINEIVAVADDSGDFTVTLASGLSQPYKVTLPDREWFYITVPVGAPTTLELLRAAFGGVPIAAGNLIGPTGPTGPQGIQGTQGIQGVAGPTGPTGSGTVIVQDGDVTVDAAAATLDFTPAAQWTVTSSPTGEVNISLALGTGATQAAAGNHTHTPTITTRSNSTAVGASAGTSIAATCVAGEEAVGGGCEFDGSSRANCEIHVTAPSGETGWTCVGTNNATPRNFIAYVRCLTTPIPS